MTLHLTPSFGPPVPEQNQQPLDVAEIAEAASKTTEMLAQHGLDLGYTDADIAQAGEVTLKYAKDPTKAARALTDKRVGDMTPAALRALDQQLRKFSQNIVEDASQIRNYVTNKLLEETENPDPRIRIKALELLGKISDVGLFADRKEVTVTHQTQDELRDALRSKLQRIVNRDTDTIEDAEYVEEPLTAEALDSAWDEDTDD